ncbi:MAG: hypothetical protein MR896_03310 [Clostridiales bacterium]|nr:hypothetical protein [Clostridiales bacterium]
MLLEDFLYMRGYVDMTTGKPYMKPSQLEQFLNQLDGIAKERIEQTEGKPLADMQDSKRLDRSIKNCYAYIKGYHRRGNARANGKTILVLPIEIGDAVQEVFGQRQSSWTTYNILLGEPERKQLQTWTLL